jgi:plastocyanin
MRKLVITLTLAVALAAGAVVAQAATTNVSWKVGSKKSLIIKRGNAVKWIWADSQPHDVRGPGLRTSIRRRPFSVRKVFRRSGRFTYICSVHPSTMKTVVRVR